MIAIEATVLYDDSDSSSYDWKFGLAEILVSEIAAVSKSSRPGAHSKIILKSGKTFHCKENQSQILKILHSQGWEKPLSREE